MECDVMPKKGCIYVALSGALAGAVAGLFGAGGGMVLVPLLTASQALSEEEVFPSSIAIILPICLVSLTVTALGAGLPLAASIPYLIGSAAGGLCAGKWGSRIPAVWLHRGLGILILWGGLRHLV